MMQANASKKTLQDGRLCSDHSQYDRIKPNTLRILFLFHLKHTVNFHKSLGLSEMHNKMNIWFIQ